MASPVFAFPSDYEDLTITQDKILTLSETLLGTLGLSGLETKQIAKRLEVSPSLINHYYKNAEELIFDTVLFSYTKLVKRIYDSFENQSNPELAARGLLLMNQFYNIDGSKKQNEDLELPYPDLSKYDIYRQ